MTGTPRSRPCMQAAARAAQQTRTRPQRRALGRRIQPVGCSRAGLASMPLTMCWAWPSCAALVSLLRLAGSLERSADECRWSGSEHNDSPVARARVSSVHSCALVCVPRASPGAVPWCSVVPLKAFKIKSNNWFLNNSRSVGLIGAVEFGYEGSKKFDVKEKIAAKCAKIIQENGVILRALPGDIIGFCPPLIINESQLNEMFDKIEEAIKDFDQTAYSLK